jgi:putative redox protein
MYAERKGWTGFRLDGAFTHRIEDGRHLIERRLVASGAPDAAGLARLKDIVERTPVTLALREGFSITTTIAQAADG